MQNLESAMEKIHTTYKGLEDLPYFEGLDDSPISVCSSLSLPQTLVDEPYLHDLPLYPTTQALDYEKSLVPDSLIDFVCDYSECNKKDLSAGLSGLVTIVQPTSHDRRKDGHRVIREELSASGSDSYNDLASFCNQMEASPPQFVQADSPDDTSTVTSMADRKRQSNREAAYRYRMKRKVQNAAVRDEVKRTHKSYLRAKMAYQRACETFNIFEKIVTDLVSTSTH